MNIYTSEKEMLKAQYSDIVSDGGLDPRNRFDIPSTQEPVAWLTRDSVDGYWYATNTRKLGSDDKPLYTSPPKHEWVGLTNAEVNNAAAGCHLGNSVQDAIRKAEAKLKEKNT